jgi:hypothetical protein
LPRNGPRVKPQTKGAVLRYCTMEMRSFAKFGVLARQSKVYRKLHRARRHAETLKCLQGLERLKHVERGKPIPSLLEFRAGKAILQRV